VNYGLEVKAFKMIKKVVKQARYFKFKDNYPRFTPGSLLTAILCAFLLVIATFSQLPFFQLVIPQEAFINVAEFFSKPHKFNEFVREFYYIPQIPAVIFIGALLGPRMGLLAVAFYFFAGILGFPVFALGGGVKYYAQLGFGYILGYFLGVILSGNLLKRKVTNFTLVKASTISVLAVHIVGIIYLTILMLIQREQFVLIISWIWVLSGMQIFYDLLMSFFAAALARPVRSILWLAMD